MAVYAEHMVEVFLTGSWTAISQYVVTDLEVEVGISDDSYENRLAEPGRLRFDLNNADGDFTPGSGSLAFTKGTPVRIQVTYAGATRTKFLGRISQVDIDTGVWGNQRMHVTALDWFDVAANQPVRQTAVQTNRSLADAVTTLLSGIPIQPDQVLVENSAQIFPTVFDAITKNTMVYGELNDLTLSEFGYAYLDQGGERLRVEASGSRKNIGELAKLPVNSDGSALKKSDGFYLRKVDGGKLLLNRTVQAVYNNTFQDLKIVHGKHILNEVAFTVYPKTVDTTLKVLFSLGQPIFLPELGTVEVKVYFRDPVGGRSINGTNLQNPVATTDYKMYANQDGTGTDLTANLIITPTFSSEGATLLFSNTGAAGYTTFLQLRGYGIYPYDPVEIVALDPSSRDIYGKRPLSIRQVYQQNIEGATREANLILDTEKDPRNVMVQAFFAANQSDQLMKTFLHVDIGSLTQIQCTKPAIDAYYFIQGLRFKITPGGVITFSWVCKELVALKALAVNFSGVANSKNAVLYDTSPRLTDLQQKTLSLWVYLRTLDNYTLMAKYGVTNGWYFVVLGTGGKLRFRQNHAGGGQDGIWDTTSGVMVGKTGAWHHIAVTYDKGSVANDPILYVDGASVAITEFETPAGVPASDSSSIFMLGNRKFISDDLAGRLDGLIKDVRVYGRILSAAEIAEIAAGENDYDSVPTDLHFQGVFVRSSRWETYVGDPITQDMKVLDRVFELPGTVTYDTMSATYQVKGADPSLTSYP